jgi:hypothetical protein
MASISHLPFSSSALASLLFLATLTCLALPSIGQPYSSAAPTLAEHSILQSLTQSPSSSCSSDIFPTSEPCPPPPDAEILSSDPWSKIILDSETLAPSHEKEIFKMAQSPDSCGSEAPCPQSPISRKMKG